MDEVEAAVQEAWTRASAQHPEVALGLGYRAHARARVAGRGEPGAKLHLGDLFIACACARGDAAALRPDAPAD